MIEGSQSILEDGLEGIQELCNRNRKSSFIGKEGVRRVLPSGSDALVLFEDGECIITFGKYSGKSFSFIHSFDPRYAKWLTSESSPVDKASKDRIAEHSIKQE